MKKKNLPQIAFGIEIGDARHADAPCYWFLWDKKSVSIVRDRPNIKDCHLFCTHPPENMTNLWKYLVKQSGSKCAREIILQIVSRLLTHKATHLAALAVANETAEKLGRKLLPQRRKPRRSRFHSSDTPM